MLCFFVEKLGLWVSGLLLKLSLLFAIRASYSNPFGKRATVFFLNEPMKEADDTFLMEEKEFAHDERIAIDTRMSCL
jgi:hypothetical protein